MNYLPVICVLLVSSGLVSCSASKITSSGTLNKIPPKQLQEDFTLLKNILEANHPSLYWYTSKDSMDFFFSETLQTLTDSLNETDFKNKIAWCLSKIHCGHTIVSHSSQFYKTAVKAKEPFFPLLLKAWKDSLVVISNIHKNDSVLKRGTIITSINEVNSGNILDSIRKLISADGYSENLKDQLITFNFPAAYANAFHGKQSYEITYVDSTGKKADISLHAYTVKEDSSARKIYRPIRKFPFRKHEFFSARIFNIDTSTSTAFLKITGFSGAGIRSFFRQSFKEIEEKNIRNLIIDLRENGGGNIIQSNVLTRYLINKPFRFADTVAAQTRNFRFANHIKPGLPYSILMHLTAHKKADGLYHFTMLENHVNKPKRKWHYNNNVYILQGGFTFSAAASFVVHLKNQSNITLVGEETGGGAYGNSAVHLPIIVLPNSKLKITLPVYRVVFNSTATKYGRGVLPDVYVPPSSAAIQEGIDIKLQVVKDLINSNNAKH